MGENDQEHWMNCLVLKLSCPSLMLNMKNTEYHDIFDVNIEKQRNVIEIMSIAHRKREELLAISIEDSSLGSPSANMGYLGKITSK